MNVSEGDECVMADERLYVNKSLLPVLDVKIPLYLICNGGLKRCLPEFLTGRFLSDDNFWYCLSELPEEYRIAFENTALSVSQINARFKHKKNRHEVLDKDNVRVYVNDDTPLLPASRYANGKDLPIFTVSRMSDDLKLIPILSCRASMKRLYDGESEYGPNVFFLVSDLTEDSFEKHIDDIILLKDVPEYLGSIEIKRDSKKFD